MIHGYDPVLTTTITDNQMDEVLGLFRTICEWSRLHHDEMATAVREHRLAAVQLNYNAMATEYKMPEMTIEVAFSGRTNIVTISSGQDWESFLASCGIIVDDDDPDLWADEEGEETLQESKGE